MHRPTSSKKPAPKQSSWFGRCGREPISPPQPSPTLIVSRRLTRRLGVENKRAAAYAFRGQVDKMDKGKSVIRYNPQRIPHYKTGGFQGRAPYDRSDPGAPYPDNNQRSHFQRRCQNPSWATGNVSSAVKDFNLARSNSEDKGSAIKGGELGWVTRRSRTLFRGEMNKLGSIRSAALSDGIRLVHRSST